MTGRPLPEIAAGFLDVALRKALLEWDGRERIGTPQFRGQLPPIDARDWHKFEDCHRLLSAWYYERDLDAALAEQESRWRFTQAVHAQLSADPEMPWERVWDLLCKADLVEDDWGEEEEMRRRYENTPPHLLIRVGSPAQFQVVSTDLQAPAECHT